MNIKKTMRVKRISAGRNLILASASLILIMIVWTIPTFVSSQSKQDDDSASNNGTARKNQNFDIRQNGTEKDELVARNSRQSSVVQNQKKEKLNDAMQKAESRLAGKKKNLEVLYSRETGAPEIVGVLSTTQKLTARSGGRKEDIVRGFISANSDLYGLTPGQVQKLKTVADYENPAGNFQWVEFEQEIGGIRVFQANMRAALTRDGEIVRTIGRTVPGLDYNEIIQSNEAIVSGAKYAGVANASSTGDAANAVVAGANSIGVEINANDLVVKEVSDDGATVVFDKGPFADDIKAELVYFPLESGAVTLSWAMTLWEDVPAYYTLVDAQTGTLLWRKNITEEQTQSATYSIYNDDSPAPFSQSTAVPGTNTQGTAIPRVNMTVTKGHPMNNLGWITDGITTTTGNNADAGLDIVSPNGIDTSGRPVSPTRTFIYDYNPAPGLAIPGSSDPSDTNYRWGAVTNLFYWSNLYHDRLYDLGFTESARNFQQDNFGRNPGGLTANARNGLDRVLAEAQDFSGTNNANFSTPADGSSGRMQMYRWNNTSPNRDGDLDQEIIIHELTHGTSNRLHNNASGLGVTVSRGMGEGWSDFYARSLLSSADEDVDGVYAFGAYATHLATAGYTNNYYYGIRRFPQAVRSNVGPNGKPHNPLTFADIDPNKIDLTDGAYARGPFGAGGRAGAVAVHNIGELWSNALLEVRARLIHRLGYEEGNQRMMQLVTDAMKMDPVNPSLIDGRNSLFMADVAYGGEDVLDIWAGFAARGMGYGAKMTVFDANVKESFDYPVPGMGDVTFVDCNGNGVADVGETLTLSVPLVNPLGQTVSGVSAQVVGGGSANYGTLNPGQTVTQNISYQVPADADCGSEITVSVIVGSNLGQQTKTFTLRLGTPVKTNIENFDGVVAPALPAGWTTTATNTALTFRTVNTVSDTAPNSVATSFLGTTQNSRLFSPVYAIPAAGSNQVTFRHSYNSEFEWDGGILLINIEGVSPDANTYTDILDAGGSFISGGYNFAFVSAASGNTNPLAGRPAWTGDSGGFITSTIILPETARGRNVKFWFFAGSDSSTTVTNAHWRIDSISLINSYNCGTVGTTTTVAASAGQYSDQAILSATVGSGCSNPTGSVEFKIDGVSAGTVPVNGNGTVTMPVVITQSPGNHTITADFTSSNPFYTNSSGSNTLTVTKENAAVSFPSTNPFSVKVNAPGGTAGPINFCADITEVADGSAGDISNATASFTFTPVAGGNSPNPGAVSYTGSGVGGTRHACVTLNNVAVDVYDVTVTVNGYYMGTNSSVLAIYDPSLGFVTGGGTVLNNGNIANFGINVKYLKNGKAQGSMLYIEHRPNGEIVKVKSNSMQSASIVNGTAVIISKATYNSEGNYTFRVTAVDMGEPGTNDRYGLQVSTPTNAVIPALNFAPVTLRGGNIQVPNN